MKPITWNETNRRLRRDWDRISEFYCSVHGSPPTVKILNSSYLCVLLYRIAHFWWSRGYGKISRLFSQLNTLLTGVDIHANSEVGGGLLIPSPSNIILSGNAGDDLTLLPLAGTGVFKSEADIGAGRGFPVIGDGVVMKASTGVLGPVRIGGRAVISNGTVATRDVPDDGVVLPVERSKEGGNDDPAVPKDCLKGCSHGSIRSTLHDFGQDIQAYMDDLSRHRGGQTGFMKRLSAVLTLPMCAVLLYRISHYLEANGLRLPALVFCWLNILINRMTVNPASCIGPGLLVPHPVGVVFNGRAGSRLTLFANSLCAGRGPVLAEPPESGPVIGDRVMVSGLAGIIGPIVVGDGVRLSHRAQLMTDAPNGALVVGHEIRFHIGKKSDEVAD